MKKILMIGDAGCHTGFARVVKGVADHLHHSGQWEVAVRGINYRPMHGIPYEYEVAPIMIDRDDPLGSRALSTHLDETQPDVLWTVQDLWTIASYLTRKPADLPAVGYFPVDTPNLKWSYGLALGALSEAVTYTHFGAREAAASVREAVDIFGDRIVGTGQLREDELTNGITMPPLDGAEMHVRLDRLARYQNPGDYNVIPHGGPDAIFTPRDRAEARRFFNLPEGAFIVGSVNTNQFRKRQDILIRAFAQFRHEHPEVDAYLVFHCAGGDWQGWDLAQLSRYYNVHDRVRAIHHRTRTLTDDDLCTLYNCFDVHVNCSGGEGWGLTTFEAAACGIPQMVPDWSATRELWKDHGLLIPVTDWRHEPKGLNTAHAIVDASWIAIMLAECTKDTFRDHWGTRALSNACRQLTWDEVGAGFATVLENALREPTQVPASFLDTVRHRQGRVVSELAGIYSADDYRLHREYEPTRD